MNIIAISGHANVGKTITVKNLIEILEIESNKEGYSISISDESEADYNWCQNLIQYYTEEQQKYLSKKSSI